MIRHNIIISIIMLGLSLPAYSSEYNFRLHHFLSEDSLVHKKFLQPWADRVESQSNGRINIEIYPAMSLGGKPTELVKQVEDGYVDMVWTLAGYTPGRFPRTEVFSLPTVHFRSAYATNRSIFANLDLIKPDYKGLKPLVVHVHAGNVFHINKPDTKTPASLAGLKIRSPSRTGNWLLNSLGAEAIQMPAPAIKGALIESKIDGTLLPFEIVPTIGLDDLGLYSVMGKDGSRFGTSIFVFLMNENTYTTLPADLQAVINNNIDLEEYKKAGILWDEFEMPGYEAQRERQVKLSLKEMIAFEDLSYQVVNEWVSDVDKLGIDGQVLVDEARKYVRRYSRIITSVDSNF